MLRKGNGHARGRGRKLIEGDEHLDEKETARALSEERSAAERRGAKLESSFDEIRGGNDKFLTDVRSGTKLLTRRELHRSGGAVFSKYRRTCSGGPARSVYEELAIECT